MLEDRPKRVSQAQSSDLKKSRSFAPPSQNTASIVSAAVRGSAIMIVILEDNDVDVIGYDEHSQ